MRFPYIYAWRASAMRTLDRKGERCRVVVRGKKNSALVEFGDGFRAVVSRNALRKMMTGCGRKIGPYRCCTVVCGDCLQLMKALPDGCVDLVLTDPPYGIELGPHGGKVSGWSRPIHGDRDQETGQKLLALVHERALALITFASSTKPWPGAWRQHLVWDKGNCTGCGGDPATCWQFDWELIQVARTGPLEGERESSILRYPMRPFAPEFDYKFHPAQKSLALMEYLITKAAAREGLVLDPFLGSGTTAVAAKKLGRHFLGFEISPEYCKIAEERIALVEMQPQLFEPKPQQATLEIAK